MISKTAGHALRAAVCIAERQGAGPVPGRALARELAVPTNYLSKTLHRLVGGGVLLSKRGRGGGFILASSPQEMTLQRVVDAVDPLGASERRCLLGRASCSDSDPCAAHGRWCEVRGMIDAFLTETMLADLLMKQGAEPGPAVPAEPSRRTGRALPRAPGG